MFNPDFYPTPTDVIFQMLEDVTIQDKIILEPSAGKGDIIDYLNINGAKEVLFCESNEDLQKISQHKAKFMTADFLNLESFQISHIDLIVMNPPFSADEKHISHAFNIAPAGCKIIALCNAQTILNAYSQSRKELKRNIELFGTFENLGDCFINSERSTGVEIGLIKLQKAGENYSTEFEGFFLDEEEEPQGDGIMSYNVVRDLVNRYVESIKIFDEQLQTAVRLNEMRKDYFDSDYSDNDRKSTISLSISRDGAPVKRADFKKAMQKSGWKFIFNKMNMQKYATRGLAEDINKFVETQTQIPFTMRNIYKMLEIVVGTTEQRMDKAILEVFDKVTQHYHENRFNVEGWKTNSNYLLNQKFIIPNMVETGWSGQVSKSIYSNFDKIEDLIKAICYITGDNYDNLCDLYQFIRYPYKVKISGNYGNYESMFDDINKAGDYHDERKKEGKDVEIEISKVEWGKWINWGYFRFKPFKKGTIHFEFLDREIWARFNQRVAKIKGFPLYEKAPDKRTEKQKAKAKAEPRPTAYSPKIKPTVLGTFKLKKETNI
jgi:hypothetical protein